MGSWRKLLRRMATDPKPVGYTYDDASRILAQLGFTRSAAGHGGSHRVWRRPRGDGTFLRVGLVDAGHGPMKREYVHEMIAHLRGEGLITGEGDLV